MNQLVLNVVLPVVSTAIGAFVTWLVARYYYEKAGNELRQETAELRRLTILVLGSLEEGGIAELNRDKSGKIIGLVIKLSAKMTGRGSMSAKAEVRRAESDDPASRK